MNRHGSRVGRRPQTERLAGQLLRLSELHRAGHIAPPCPVALSLSNNRILRVITRSVKGQPMVMTYQVRRRGGHLQTTLARSLPRARRKSRTDRVQTRVHHGPGSASGSGGSPPAAADPCANANARALVAPRRVEHRGARAGPHRAPRTAHRPPGEQIHQPLIVSRPRKPAAVISANTSAGPEKR